MAGEKIIKEEFDLSKYTDPQDEILCESEEDAMAFASFLDEHSGRRPKYFESFVEAMSTIFNARRDDITDGIWIFFNLYDGSLGWNFRKQKPGYKENLYFSDFVWPDNAQELPLSISEII